MIDLHTHTCHSDGTLTPTELVAAAAAAGITAMAVTDHDTTQGVDAAVATGERMGVTVLPGIEISSESEGLGSVHVLGYLVDHRDATFQERLCELRESRDGRNRRIAERLRSLGVDITLEEVVALAAGAVLGRPHFARVLVARGIVGDIQEAFDRYLATGRPAYVSRDPLSVADAARWIREAGGVSSIAHPSVYRHATGLQMGELLERLDESGVDGFEAFHYEHGAAITDEVEQFARRRGRLVTGGSDFHGALKPDVFLGRGRGNVTVPPECLDALLQAARARRAERARA